jgi:putative oligomerization/nucleic acid binding protein
VEGSAPPATARVRKHRGLVRTFIVLGAVIGFFAVFAVWVSRQLLETDTWTSTSSQMLENHDIQVALAGFMTDALYSSVDVQGQLEKALPPKAAPLAGPAAGGLRELANRLALEALQRPQIQDLWEQANRAAQQTLLTIVKGGTSTVSTQNGTVTLNLSTIIDQLGQELGVDVSGKVPPSVGSVTVLKSSQLSTAQDIINALRPLALALTLITLALFALAIYLAEGWRREALRSCGIAFVAVGIVILFARSLAGNYVVNGLESAQSLKDAAHAAWIIATSLLAAEAAAVIMYGIVVVLGAWLAGPGRVARWSRQELTPVLRDARLAYGALAFILLLVFWWNPTPGTARLLPSLLLIILAVAGVEALRRVAVRDFPDETMAMAGARWGRRVDVVRARFGPSEAATAQLSASPQEDRISALERLARLHDSGALTDAEFEREKASLPATG